MNDCVGIKKLQYNHFRATCVKGSCTWLSNCILTFLNTCNVHVPSTMEPPNNGQVGALTLVHYSEVSFIGGFSQKSKFLFVEHFCHGNST